MSDVKNTLPLNNGNFPRNQPMAAQESRQPVASIAVYRMAIDAVVLELR